MKKIKEQRGSVTLFILIACLFMITILLLVNIAMMNKNASQEKEIIQISRNYSVNETDLSNSYANVADENGYPNYTEIQKMIESALETTKLEIFPVGSIYISTNSTNPGEYLGGTWESYGQGRTLIGAGTGTDSNGTTQSFQNGQTGGEYSHTLTKEEMPSHNHTVIPTGSVNSTFIGSAVNTSTLGNHAHTTSATSLINGATNSTGDHAHGIFNSNTAAGYGEWLPGNRVETSNGVTFAVTANQVSARIKTHWALLGMDYAGIHSHSVSGTIPAMTTSTVGNHYHSVTAAGSVTSRFTGNNTTTSSTGSGKAANVLEPYIATYIWKRIS